MYRKKHVLFYTASLMISNDITEIDRYLRHPSKEPEYRQGRSHAEFLTTLSREYPAITVTRAKTATDDVVTQHVEEIE
jgi:lipoate-protein ligase A